MQLNFYKSIYICSIYQGNNIEHMQCSAPSLVVFSRCRIPFPPLLILLLQPDSQSNTHTRTGDQAQGSDRRPPLHTLVLLGVDVRLERLHLLPRRRPVVVLDGPVHVVGGRAQEHQPAGDTYQVSQTTTRAADHNHQGEAGKERARKTDERKTPRRRRRRPRVPTRRRRARSASGRRACPAASSSCRSFAASVVCCVTAVL